MKRVFVLAVVAAVGLLVAGCETVPPGVERGPRGTIAYDVLIEASPPGAKIEVNGEQIGAAPLHLKIYGDKDGTFHDFGSYYYIIRALPVATNQFVQTRVFRTGRWFTPEDLIPRRIYFDMNQNTPAPPVYLYPSSPPPVYYYPGPYFGPPLLGPRLYFHFGPGHWHRHW